MLPLFAARVLLLPVLFAAVAATPHNEGCDCEAICAEIVARQQKEIARLQAELHALRGYVDLAGRRLSCARDWNVSSDADVEAFGLEGCRAAKTLNIRGRSSITSLARLSGLETVENLQIGSTMLQSLTGLESLTRVEGLLTIEHNQQLRSLYGLQGLETAGAVKIDNCPGLQSLTGLGNLTRVGGELAVWFNYQLTSLDGLQGLRTAGAIDVHSNVQLQSLTGLENLARVEHLLRVRYNERLRSLDGLQGLETAGELDIDDNSELQSTTGLENLTRVEGRLSIWHNDQLTSLDGLQGLETAGAVDIHFNPWLQSLTGLENLARVEEWMSITRNHHLTSLTGLQGLKRAYEISVEDTALLESLSGLESLTHVGRLTLDNLPELRSIAGLRSLTSIWHWGMIISNCPKLHSLEGLGKLRASQLRVQKTPLNFLGGPFATGSSVHELHFDAESWPHCFTPHERVSLLSVVEDTYTSHVPSTAWEPACGTDFGTFWCTKGHPCSFSLAGEESNYTSVFVSASFTGCGTCSVNHPQGEVAEGGKVDLGYVLGDEEPGLHSVCRCAGGIGPVAQLFLRGPRRNIAKACSRGRNCTFRVEGEALECADRVVLMTSCNNSNPSSGIAPSLTADRAYLLHDPLTWYDAPAAQYQVCWRAPCTSAPNGPACLEDSYVHVGGVELVGAYPRNYAPVLGEDAPFSVPNIGLGVADGDQMRLRRACGEADEEEAYVLVASSSGMVFDFGRLTEDRVRAGRHQLCWCNGRDGAQCNAAWHFRAPAGAVEIRCPAGQELVDSRLCESCPAGKQQPGPGLNPCLECPIGQFSRGATERCEVCPRGEVARLRGSSTCVACLAWQIADSEATGCSTDPVTLVLLALLSFSVGAIPAILAYSIRRRLWVGDVSLIQDQTIVTTIRPHGLTNFGRPSFPVRFHGTGHPDLDSPSGPFRARVKDAMHLELLTSANKSIKYRLDTSMGTLTVAFPHDLGHQRIVAVGLPVLSTVAAALSSLVLSVDLIPDARRGTGAVALTCTAAVAALRRRPRGTPLSVRLSEFQQKLRQRLRRSRRVAKGPKRAITIGKMYELLEFFHDFIRDRTAYYLDANVIKPLTRTKKISYAELVGARKVEWFVSHYWGTPFEHFCASLRKHAEMFCGQRDWTTLCYWVCFCSINQYEIREELGGGAGWVESSFYLTLRSGKCRGTCMVLDDKALPLTRIWCIFELIQTVKLERSEAGFQGLLLCTSGGVLNTGGGSPEVATALAEKVAGMNLQTAQATNAADATMIREQVIREMGSFTTLNRFICGQMRAMLVRAQQHSSQKFVHVLAELDQAVMANSLESV